MIVTFESKAIVRQLRKIHDCSLPSFTIEDGDLKSDPSSTSQGKNGFQNASEVMLCSPFKIGLSCIKNSRTMH